MPKEPSILRLSHDPAFPVRTSRSKVPETVNKQSVSQHILDVNVDDLSVRIRRPPGLQSAVPPPGLLEEDVVDGGREPAGGPSRPPPLQQQHQVSRQPAHACDWSTVSDIIKA